MQSGKTLEQFFIEEIFTPLGMQDGYFYLPKSKHDRLVTLYAEVEKEGLIVSEGNESSLTFDNPLYPTGDVQAYFQAVQDCLPQPMITRALYKCY